MASCEGRYGELTDDLTGVWAVAVGPTPKGFSLRRQEIIPVATLRSNPNGLRVTLFDYFTGLLHLGQEGSQRAGSEEVVREGL